MCDFDLGKRFRLILSPFNGMLMLHELEEAESCFRCVNGFDIVKCLGDFEGNPLTSESTQQIYLTKVAS